MFSVFVSKLEYIFGTHHVGVAMDPDTFNFKLHLQGRALSNHSVNAREFGVSLIGLNDTLSVIAKQMAGTQQTSAETVMNFVSMG